MKKKQVMCLLLASVMVGTGGAQMLGGSGNIHNSTFPPVKLA